MHGLSDIQGRYGLKTEIGSRRISLIRLWNLKERYHGLFASGFLPSGFPWWLSGKEPICQCRRCRFDPWIRKISWRRKWQPTSVFLPGKSHIQRSLVGYSQWGVKRVRHDLATQQQQQQPQHLTPQLLTIYWAPTMHRVWGYNDGKIGVLPALIKFSPLVLKE